MVAKEEGYSRTQTAAKNDPRAVVAGVPKPSVEQQLEAFKSGLPAVYTVLNDDNDYVAASDILTDIVKRRKELDELRKNITRPMDEAKKKVMDLFRPVENQVIEVERQLKTAIATYDAKQKQKRLQQEAALRAAHDEEKRFIEDQAELLRAQGKHDQADELEETIPATLPVVVENRPKTNVTIRTTWKAEPPKTKHEWLRLLDYVIKNDAWNLIMVNQSAIDALARSYRGTGTVPGLNFYEEKTVASR